LSRSKAEELDLKTTEKAAAESAGFGPVPSRFLGPNGNHLVRRLLPWAHKGGLTIVDQGLISGSNFLVNILLARWLTPEQYGAYAIAFGIFILLSLVYQSLVLEPMSVFGGSTYQHKLREYFFSLLWIHTGLSLVIFLLFGASAAISRALGQPGGLPGALAGVTIASPCVLFFWLARRCLYLEASPSKAVIGAFVYSSFVLGALWIFYKYHLLSAFTSFVLIAIGALGTGVVLTLRLGFSVRRSEHALSTWATWQQHWRYGGWALAGAIASWIPANIYYPLLSSFGSMAHSGELKALMNITLPLEQIKSALSLLLLPYAASVQHGTSESRTKTLTWRLTLLGLGIAVAYWAVIIPLNRPVFQFLYSGRYMDVAHYLPLVSVGSLFWSAAYGPALALRGLKAPALVFWAYTASTVASLIIGVPATWYYGLAGGIWGNNVADIVSLAGVFYFLHRKMKKSPLPAAAH
jgi:O-antigen/teichoic acid export membrane protein